MSTETVLLFLALIATIPVLAGLIKAAIRAMSLLTQWFAQADMKTVSLVNFGFVAATFVMLLTYLIVTLLRAI